MKDIIKTYACNFCLAENGERESCRVTVAVKTSTVANGDTIEPKYCPVCTDMVAPWKEVINAD